MADSSRHKKDLTDYLGRHRRLQKQGSASPSKPAQPSRQPHEMPDIKNLNIQDPSPVKARPASSKVTGLAAPSRPHQAKTRGAVVKGSSLAPRSCQPVRTLGRKATINDLPTELLLHIFGLLPPNVLLTCACVNRQWMELASDNVLWQPLYEQYASRPTEKKTKSAASKSKPAPSRPHPVYALHADVKWKKACIKECINKRNSRIASLLKKTDPYTLLPANTAKTIQKLGVQWQLVLTDSNKAEHSFTHSDAFHHATSSSVRWYSLDPPPIRALRCLAVYALAPVLFNKDGLALKNSPCQRALLLEQRIKTSEVTCDPRVESEAINVYTLPAGIILATWKEGGEIAFVSLCLHHHGIIQRATQGTSGRMHIPAHIKPRPDDVDPEYGLHDYTCVMELRHQRTVAWSQRYDRLHASKQEKVEGFLRLSPVRGDIPTDHSYTSSRIHFPWKTDVFKGIVKEFAVLDCTLYDEFQQPIWCISSPVSIVIDEKAPVTMEYDGDPCVIHYTDHKGNVDIRMIWIPDREKHIVVAINIDVALKTVNDWFGTHY